MPLNPRDVVITGMGVISPIGLSVPELRESLLQNRSGIRLWQSPQSSRTVAAGLIDRDFSDQFSKLELAYMDRCSQVAMLAARPATADAGTDDSGSHAERAGLYYGSVTGGVKTEHEWVRQFHVNKLAHSPRLKTVMACRPALSRAILSTSTRTRPNANPGGKYGCSGW